MKTETIAGIATAMKNSGIGIIRISGQEAFEVIDRVYRSKDQKKIISKMKSHTIHYGYIYDGETFIDEVMVVIMKAPNTYTKEDVIEINCHGGILVTKKVLETVLKYGARPAEPGEFTKRAFLNGRIDLSQAESVMDYIQAKNEFALKSSQSQLQGKLKNKIENIRGVLLHEIAFIETALDDPEHISLEGYEQQLKEKVEKQLSEINQLLESSKNGMLLSEGINTVIVGKPNAGKSSLMNAMLKKERAIVTEIAGTTRDVIEEQMNLGDITLNIIDTAGIRNTTDIVEKIGVKKAKEYLEQADLVLYVIDSSVDLDYNDYVILELLKEKNTIILLNKSDLQQVVTEEKIKEKLDKTIIKISAKENDGLEALEKSISEMFLDGEIQFNDEIYITNIRHENALREGKESLNNVLMSIENQMPEDFYSIDLMNAYEILGYIIGASIEDDLVNEIFSKFCMGK